MGYFSRMVTSLKRILGSRLPLCLGTALALNGCAVAPQKVPPFGVPLPPVQATQPKDPQAAPAVNYGKALADLEAQLTQYKAQLQNSQTQGEISELKAEEQRLHAEFFKKAIRNFVIQVPDAKKVFEADGIAFGEEIDANGCTNITVSICLTSLTNSPALQQ